jgi:MoxR-like ATPase
MSTIQQWAEQVTTSVEKVVYGKSEVIEKLLVALLCRGHALLEDNPGVGKTILARALSTVLGGDFKRIQCTPDLLPADVLGVSIYNPKTGEFTFKQGPIMANVLLVDEINRATPRTQSALLEAMTDFKISVEGRALQLPDPFFIIATQNPVEFEGTFPLPEAQKDRFLLSLSMGYPPEEAEAEIMVAQQRLTHPVTDLKPVTDLATVIELQQQVTSVNVPEETEEIILRLVSSTRNDTRLTLGASPRASMALYRGSQALAAIRGRSTATLEDVIELAPAVLQKRIAVKPEMQLKGVTEIQVIDQLLEQAKATPAEESA